RATAPASASNTRNGTTAKGSTGTPARWVKGDNAVNQSGRPSSSPKKLTTPDSATSTQPTGAMSRGAHPASAAHTASTTRTAGSRTTWATSTSPTRLQSPVTPAAATPVSSPVATLTRTAPRATTTVCDPSHAA